MEEEDRGRVETHIIGTIQSCVDGQIFDEIIMDQNAKFAFVYEARSIHGLLTFINHRRRGNMGYGSSAFFDIVYQLKRYINFHWIENKIESKRRV